jgi:hypothetical protein
VSEDPYTWESPDIPNGGERANARVEFGESVPADHWPDMLVRRSVAPRIVGSSGGSVTTTLEVVPLAATAGRETGALPNAAEE